VETAIVQSLFMYEKDYDISGLRQIIASLEALRSPRIVRVSMNVFPLFPQNESLCDVFNSSADLPTVPFISQPNHAVSIGLQTASSQIAPHALHDIDGKCVDEMSSGNLHGSALISTALGHNIEVFPPVPTGDQWWDALAPCSATTTQSDDNVNFDIAGMSCSYEALSPDLQSPNSQVSPWITLDMGASCPSYPRSQEICAKNGCANDGQIENASESCISDAANTGGTICVIPRSKLLAEVKLDEDHLGPNCDNIVGEVLMHCLHGHYASIDGMSGQDRVTADGIDEICCSFIGDKAMASSSGIGHPQTTSQDAHQADMNIFAVYNGRVAKMDDTNGSTEKKGRIEDEGEELVSDDLNQECDRFYSDSHEFVADRKDPVRSSSSTCRLREFQDASHGEIDNEKRPKQMQKPPTTASISLEDLKAVFHLHRPEAEKKLQLKRTTFSNLSRHFGIAKWPFRTLRDADKRILHNVHLLEAGGIGREKKRKILAQQRRLGAVKKLMYDEPHQSKDSNTLSNLLKLVESREGVTAGSNYSQF
jgi:RWP-RK domain